MRRLSSWWPLALAFVSQPGTARPASDPASPRPRVRVLRLADPSPEPERTLIQGLRLELPEHIIEVADRESAFVQGNLTEQARATRVFFADNPAGAVVWLAAPSPPAVYVLTRGGSQPELRLIEGTSWREVQGSVVAWLDELLDRLRLADAPLPRSPPQWSASAEGGTVASAVEGGALDGLVLLRALLAHRLGSTWSGGLGLEGFAASIGRSGGWGIGPAVRLELPRWGLLRGGLTASLLAVQLPIPDGYEDEGIRIGVRTSGYLGVEGTVDGWLFGLAAEVGVWPLRSRFDVAGQEDVGTPRLDVGGLARWGREF